MKLNKSWQWSITIILPSNLSSSPKIYREYLNSLKLYKHSHTSETWILTKTQEDGERERNILRRIYGGVQVDRIR